MDNPFAHDYRVPEAVETVAPLTAAASRSHITYHAELIQGTEEWLALRLGILTASEIKHILTAKTLKIASSDKERSHVFEILSQRITEFVEPGYISDDMLRGRDDEIEARHQYSKNFAPAVEVGFITNDKWGFTIGYSPDGLVGEDGLIECKSRLPKYQVRTIAENEVPDEYVLQLQTGLLVSEREWIDFVSYSAGLPIFVKRVYPDPQIQTAIVEAATAFEARVEERARQYHATIAAMPIVIPTERKVEEVMF